MNRVNRVFYFFSILSFLFGLVIVAIALDFRDDWRPRPIDFAHGPTHSGISTLWERVSIFLLFFLFRERRELAHDKCSQEVEARKV
jgi:hypothetical protein